jgi:hypothetical protein
MPDKTTTDLEQLCGILEQFDTATVLAAVERAVPPGEMARLGTGVGGTGMLVLPPMILSTPTGVEQRRLEDRTRSADCGPGRVKTTEKGDWNSDKSAARDNARNGARTAAADACGGDCPGNQVCRYTESSNTLMGPEEKQDPQNPNVTLYRYECISEGACLCEKG